MREIKFRAWDNVNNWWCFYNNCDCMIHLNNPTCNITEFTWLKDKNWKDIYEWDIVEVNTFEHWNIRMYVIYDAPSFFLSPSIVEKINVMKFSTPNVHETVIWNIYENINLLN